LDALRAEPRGIKEVRKDWYLVRKETHKRRKKKEEKGRPPTVEKETTTDGKKPPGVPKGMDSRGEHREDCLLNKKRGKTPLPHQVKPYGPEEAGPGCRTLA